MNPTYLDQAAGSVLPFQSADTLVLDNEAAVRLRERLVLRQLAAEALIARGWNPRVARRTAGHLGTDVLWAIVRGQRTPKPAADRAT